MINVDLYKRFRIQIANFGIYFWAALIPMILSLVSNPFITKNMSPEDFAIVGYYTAFNSLFGPLINFYLLHYYTKRYFELDELGRNTLKSTLFKALIIFSLLMTGVALISLFVYTIIFNKNTQIPFMPYAVISILALPITGIYTLTLTEFRMSRQSKKFFSFSVTNSVVAIGISLLFVVTFQWGAIGKLSATLLATSLMFLYILSINRDIWNYRFDKIIFKDAILFCWPLVIASMLTFFCTGYDKVILERQDDIHALGIYSVGVTIAGYLHLFSNSINDTFQPDIYETIVKRQFSRCAKFVAMKLSIMSICVMGFIVLAPFIIDVLTFGKYVESAPYARIIAISSVTSMLYYSMSQITVALGFTSITLTNKIAGSLISIISFNYLIARYGVIGASWGVVLSYLYFFLGNATLVYWKYKKIHKA